jgi:sugar phosphate isomerase/epimerase
LEERVKTCLNPNTLRQGLSLDDLIDAASAAGFDGIEARGPAVGEYVEAHGLAALRDRLAAAGLGVASIGYGVPLRATGEEFERALAAAPDVCELASGLGAAGGAVVLPPRQGDGFAVTRDETVERIGRLARLAAGYGLEVYIEFVGLHLPDDFTWTKTLGDALDMADEIGLPNVGPLIDSYHWHLGGSRAEDLARIRPGAPILAHINDAPPGDVTTLTDAMRVLPGEGVLDLPAWLRAIRDATGYDGCVSLELFNEELRALEPAEAAARAKASLDAVLAAV